MKDNTGNNAYVIDYPGTTTHWLFYYDYNGNVINRKYNLTDHLGNVRVVIKKGATGVAEIVQQKGYYSFGMLERSGNPDFSGEISQGPFSYDTGTSKNWYNGKEIQDDFGLYWYDYGARFYDPMLGRWHSVDPMAEKFPAWSPYVYTLNNPLNLVDPDGREPITLTALVLKMAIGAGIGAVTDISVQMTANMSLHGQSFSEAFGNVAWKSVGASATIGAAGIPKVNTVAKAATIDYTTSKGTESVFNGKKTLNTATIDAAGSLIGGKATDDILKGAKKSIANDINSGTFSTLTKVEKNTLRQTQSVVNSKGKVYDGHQRYYPQSETIKIGDTCKVVYAISDPEINILKVNDKNLLILKRQ